MSTLNALLKHLLKENIEFVIVGDFAAVIYGTTIDTTRVEICTPFTEQTIEHLKSAFKDINPFFRGSENKVSFLEHAHNADGEKSIFLETDMGGIDVLASVEGVGDYTYLKEHSMTMPLFGQTCHVITVEDLIKEKSIEPDDHDMQVLAELKKIAAHD